MKTLIIKTIYASFICLLLSFGYTNFALADSNNTVIVSGIKIPNSIPGIWQAIDIQFSELNNAIQARAYADVHYYAYAIRDLVTASQNYPKALPSDKFNELKAQIKTVNTLATQLDQSGDELNKTATLTNFKNLQNEVNTIRTYYSPTKNVANENNN